MKRVQQAVVRAGWKKVVLASLLALLLLIVIVQFIYPFGRTIPYAQIDTIMLGGLTRDEAKQRVQDAYDTKQLDIYFGDATEAYRSPSLKELGVSVASDELVDRTMYPWWLRLVPTSLWWGHKLVDDQVDGVHLSKQAIQTYAEKELGESCRVVPKNASITVENDALTLVPVEDGGRCEMNKVIGLITEQRPTFAVESTVRIPVQRIKPAIGDTDAEKVITTVNERLEQGVTLMFHEKVATLEGKTVRSWLEFGDKDDQLTVTVSAKKAREVLEKEAGQAVAKPAGVVTIKTHDFLEVSRTAGADGRSLDVDKTVRNIASYLMKRDEEARVAVRAIPAEKKYQRTYSATHTGLSARMKHYAETHKGTYGVSLIELSGQRRRAGYQETKKFTTASTYKAYVAYSTLRRVENGTLKWNEQIAGGRNLAKCFDDMIVLSDNPCAEALVKKIGYNALHADVQALGLGGTSFIDKESFKTTAGDLSTFMASLASNQLPISTANKDRFIGALKRNVYRQGIPAGVSGTVADKVGFLDGLLHDTAIVYAPSGTYVLTIMTDGSSWGSIAELTREIEKLRVR